MDEVTNSHGIFQVLDASSVEPTPEVLGLWAIGPLASTEALAFGAASGEMADAPVWRANLPAAPHLAESQLTSAELKLRTSQKALTVAAERLDALISTRVGGLAFDSPSAAGTLAAPEVELLRLLSEMREGEPEVRFGLGERLSGGWEQASQQFQAILERLQRVIARYAWVETQVQGEFLGRTAVSWTGDVDTLWRAGISPEQLQLHQRTLALALQSREMLTRTLVMATQFVVKLAVLLSMPGGVILALPAAWKFINQVLAEFAQQE